MLSRRKIQNKPPISGLTACSESWSFEEKGCVQCQIFLMITAALNMHFDRQHVWIFEHRPWIFFTAIGFKGYPAKVVEKVFRKFRARTSDFVNSACKSPFAGPIEKINQIKQVHVTFVSRSIEQADHFAFMSGNGREYSLCVWSFYVTCMPPAISINATAE